MCQEQDLSDKILRNEGRKMNWAFNVPIKFSYKGLEELKKLIKSACDGENTALIMSGSAIRRYGMAELMKELRQKEGFIHLDHVAPNPSPEDIYELIEKTRGKNISLIIAVGGGSAIDSAKAVSAIYTFDVTGYRQITEIIRKKEYKNEALADKAIPIIAVPTTAGTGSEATMWATVWDRDSNKKLSVEAPWLYPREAWLVPELTLGMPPELTLATGLDALCHAVEAYWSRNSNPLVRSIAREAITVIRESLPGAIKEPDNLAYREKMLTGATLAGLAFTNTRTTACHSISYPMTALYGIPHGLAAATTLPGVLARNLDAIPDRTALLDAFGCTTPQGVAQWLQETASLVRTLRLSDFGLSAADLEKIARESFTEGRMDNNPVTLTEEDVMEILREAY